jgi:pimeloyl-ACP methyl ester carboxylesterase
MLEYRGYGLSTGTPNEQGLVIDAQTGLDYIRSRDDLKNGKIVVFGQSIGGAVAIDLVSKNQEVGDIKGLVLENTFLSIAKMIPSAIPVAKWLTPFCHEYWRSEVMMPKITSVPVLFLSGLQDEIVPWVFPCHFLPNRCSLTLILRPSHMKELFRLCKSKTVVWKELPYGDHNSSVAEPGYFNYIDEFIWRNVLDG